MNASASCIPAGTDVPENHSSRVEFMGAIVGVVQAIVGREVSRPTKAEKVENYSDQAEIEHQVVFFITLGAFMEGRVQHCFYNELFQLFARAVHQQDLFFTIGIQPETDAHLCLFLFCAQQCFWKIHVAADLFGKWRIAACGSLARLQYAAPVKCNKKDDRFYKGCFHEGMFFDRMTQCRKQKLQPEIREKKD
jgi:hypothetical protein